MLQIKIASSVIKFYLYVVDYNYCNIRVMLLHVLLILLYYTVHRVLDHGQLPTWACLASSHSMLKFRLSRGQALIQSPRALS